MNKEIEEIRKLHNWLRDNLGLVPFTQEIKTLYDKWAPIDVTSFLLDEIDRSEKRAYADAAKEVLGWRELTIKAHNACPTTNPKETLREVGNTLRLLGVIESKLRQKAGEDKAAIYHDMKQRDEPHA